MAAKILKTLEKTTRDALTNKYVLYVLLFLAMMNVIAFLATDNFISLAIFALIGVLVSYFTKNMSMVLIVTLVVSSFLHITRKTVETMVNKDDKKKNKKNKKEGMENQEDDFEDAAPVKESDSDEESDNEDEKSDEAPMMDKKKKGSVNHQKTIEEAYGNIENVLGNKNFKKMSKDAMTLMEQQEKLTESMNSMAPLIQNAGSLLEKMDVEAMTGMLQNLGGMNFGGKKKKN